MLRLAISGHEEFWIFILWGEEESTQCEGSQVMTFVCAQHLFRAGKEGCLRACGEAALFQLWLRRGFLGWCCCGLGHAPRHHNTLAWLPEDVMASLVVGFACSLLSVLLWNPGGHWAGWDHRILGTQAVRDQSRMRHEESLLIFELGSHGAVCTWKRKYRDDFKYQQSVNMLIGFN